MRPIGMRDAAEIERAVESIWSRREMRDLVSRKTLLELLLEHIGAVVRGMPTPMLSEKIVDLVVHAVGHVSVLIPIEELFVDGEFPFATAFAQCLGLFSDCHAGRRPVPDAKGIFGSSR